MIRAKIPIVIEKKRKQRLSIFFCLVLELNAIAYNRWSCLSDANVPSARWFSLLPLRRLRKYKHRVSYLSINYSIYLYCRHHHYHQHHHHFFFFFSTSWSFIHSYYINILNYIDCLSLDGCGQRTTRRQVTLFVHFN